MLRRSVAAAAAAMSGRHTSRYTDGTGRRLDGMEPPTDLVLDTISNKAYPPKTAYWQPAVIEGDDAKHLMELQTPHKGRVVVSGGGVVGSVAALLFALRGFFVTVVERRSCPNGDDGAPHHVAPVHRVEYALLTKRALNVLEAAGLPLALLKPLGVKVRGVLDHPGGLNSWLTHGLSELSPFPINMLSIDLVALRKLLDMHVRTLPVANCHVFYDHMITSVVPPKKKCVVKPLRDFAASPEGRPINHPVNNWETSLTMKLSTLYGAAASDGGATDEAVLPEDGSIPYDLLVACEGTNSRARDLVDVEGTSFHHDFGVQWFTVTTAALDSELIHRWMYPGSSGYHAQLVTAFPMVPEEVVAASPAAAVAAAAGTDGAALPSSATAPRKAVGKIIGAKGTVVEVTSELNDDAEEAEEELRSAVPAAEGSGGTAAAKPSSRRRPQQGASSTPPHKRVYKRTTFAVMAFMRTADVKDLTPDAFLATFMADVLRADGRATMERASQYAVPSPTIFCDRLVNSVGLPNCAMLGDAAHFCHPFWLQNLSIGLEDVSVLLSCVDNVSTNFHDGLTQYSRERGIAGDALRIITERSLFYQRRKHVNPILRFQNWFGDVVHRYLPTWLNQQVTMYNFRDKQTLTLAPRRLEVVLNGRNYSSYEAAGQHSERAMTRLWKLYT